MEDIAIDSQAARMTLSINNKAIDEVIVNAKNKDIPKPMAKANPFRNP